jgi:hypothetical protein
MAGKARNSEYLGIILQGIAGSKAFLRRTVAKARKLPAGCRQRKRLIAMAKDLRTKIEEAELAMGLDWRTVESN